MSLGVTAGAPTPETIGGHARCQSIPPHGQDSPPGGCRQRPGGLAGVDVPQTCLLWLVSTQSIQAAGLRFGSGPARLQFCAREIVRSPRGPMGQEWMCSVPLHHTRLIWRVALMSLMGSSSISTRSARRPGLMMPRSVRSKCWAGGEVAARRASIVGSPASTSSSSSWCRLSPCGILAGCRFRCWRRCRPGLARPAW
jgi:hypothetical protein